MDEVGRCSFYFACGNCRGGVLLLPERENVSEQVFSEIPGRLQ